MRHNRLELPTGQLVTAHQIIVGVALLELGASDDMKISHKILRYARALRNIKK